MKPGEVVESGAELGVPPLHFVGEKSGIESAKSVQIFRTWRREYRSSCCATFQLDPNRQRPRQLGIAHLVCVMESRKHAVQGDLTSDGASSHGDSVDATTTLQLTLVRAIEEKT